MNNTQVICDRCHDGCRFCGGERQVLGQLGDLMHFRCRHCGMLTSQQVDEEDDFANFDGGDYDDYESPYDGSEDLDDDDEGDDNYEQ